jgi:hypothetical protein
MVHRDKGMYEAFTLFDEMLQNQVDLNFEKGVL